VSAGSVWDDDELPSTATAHAEDRRATAAAARIAPVAEFKAGDHVRHDKFGQGIVVSYRRVKEDAEVTVAFDGAGLKRLLLSFARIEKY
jgi:hypothetical protein